MPKIHFMQLCTAIFTVEVHIRRNRSSDIYQTQFRGCPLVYIVVLYGNNKLENCLMRFLLTTHDDLFWPC